MAKQVKVDDLNEAEIVLIKDTMVKGKRVAAFTKIKVDGGVAAQIIQAGRGLSADDKAAIAKAKAETRARKEQRENRMIASGELQNRSDGGEPNGGKDGDPAAAGGGK